MNEKFKPGDTVQLKSGGLPMTVEPIDTVPENLVACVWFQGTTLKRDAFFTVELIRIYYNQ